MPVVIDQIIRSKRKTMALIVRSDGFVIVRAPLRAPNLAIQEFITKNAAWIEKKQAQVRALVVPEPKQFIAGERFEFLGSSYPLEIVKGQKKSLLLEDGKFNGP